MSIDTRPDADRALPIQIESEVAPNSCIVTSDTLVLGRASEQWETIAAQSGQRTPTPTQCRARAVLAGSRDGNIDPSDPWSVIDIQPIEPKERWQELAANLPPKHIRDRSFESAPTPTLTVVVANESDDKISYLLQAITHGTAIGAKLAVFAGQAVRDDFRVNALLDKIGLQPGDIFVGGEELGAYQAELSQLNFWEHTHDLATVFASEEDYSDYLRRYLTKNEFSGIAQLEAKLSLLYGERSLALGEGSQFSQLLLERIQVNERRRANILHKAETERLAMLKEVRDKKQELLYAEDVRIAEIVKQVNDDKGIHGILTLLPGHTQAGEQLIRDAHSNPAKDLDGAHTKSSYPPITPEAAIGLAEHNVGDLSAIPEGEIAVFGLGLLVGDPLVKILNARGITPGLVLKGKQDIEEWRERCKDKALSVIFACARAASYIKARGLTPGKNGILIVDAGNVKAWDPQADDYRSFSNVDPDSLSPELRVATTPLYRGLGPATVAKLFDRLIQTAREQQPPLSAWQRVQAIGSFMKHLVTRPRLQSPLPA